MYKKIILAYDGSDSGQKAIIECKEMKFWNDPEIYLLSVIAPYSSPVVDGGYLDLESNDKNIIHSQNQLDAGVELIKKEGLVCSGRLLIGNPVKEITQFAKNNSCDLIIVMHKHIDSVFKRWWANQPSVSIVEESPCNVLIVVS
jgi:nucleotide-binding universal stress UspA family protein